MGWLLCYGGGGDGVEFVVGGLQKNEKGYQWVGKG